MICDICFRAPDPRLSFYCPTCARNQLYQLRVENARVLLEKGSIGQHIEDAISRGESQEEPTEPDRAPPRLEDGATRRWAHQAATTRQVESAARTRELNERIKSLKSEIKDKQTEISQRKAVLARRHSDAESAKYQLVEREDAMLAGIQNNTKRTDHLWNSLHGKMAEARIYLCREAANLYGLRKKTVDKDGVQKDVYVVTGVPIVDLRDMNGPPATHISTSLTNVARVIVLVSHYLSLKLPAEIVLPHRNHPTPAIYAPSASYISTDNRSRLPRPRPLFIGKSLRKVATEDPGTYNLFLEGATLLAWNISWLCRTQGISLGSDSWEDVCDIGKNLWQLLVASPAQASTLTRAFAGRDIQTKLKAAKDSPKTTIQRTKSFPMLGHYSHGTVHSFLGASEGTQFMRTWRLPTFTKVVDKLKSTLLGEIASAEWELLDKTEWDDAEEPPQPSSEEPPTAPESDGKQELHAEKDDASHVALASAESTEHDKAERGVVNEHVSAGRQKGSSGWMKLRSR